MCNELMSEKAIVAFVDILGYKRLIERYMNNLPAIKDLELILSHCTLGLKEKFKNKLFTDSTYQEFKNKIIDLIKIKIISDTIIFTIPVSEITFTNPVQKKKTISDCITIYFNVISMFSTLFISHTGCLLRGGIAIGPHYESDLKKGNGNFFIFSKAYIDAYLLEKMSRPPRIVIDHKLISYLTEQSFEGMDHFIFHDVVDGKQCFNFYAHINQIDEQYKIVLTEIKNALEAQIKLYAYDKDIIDKLSYFIKYHNHKVSEKDLNCKELSIG